MEDLLKFAYDPEKFREQGHQLIDLLANHLQTCFDDNGTKVTLWKEPEDQLAYWKSYQSDSKNPLPLFREILKRSIHIHHPRYIGHQICPTLPVSALSALLSALLNNGMAIYEMGSASTAIEKVVCDFFLQQVGYPKTGDALLTSGGTLANLTALLSARSEKAGINVWENGSGDSPQLALMVSEEAHYCIDRAVRVMGWGALGIIKIPTNADFKMEKEALEIAFKNAEDSSVKIIALVGSACTTSTGTYDDLEMLAEFAEAHDLWFHVDGAHGGAAIFSEKYRHLVKGIERSDSVVVDCHKMLMAPSLTTVLLFKQEKSAYQTFHQQAQYLWADNEQREWYNVGKRAFECTKHMMSIRVYSILRTYGPDLFEAFVTRLYDLGQTAAKLIASRPDFELAIRPEANIVCFRYTSNAEENTDLNRLNRAIRQKLLETGDYYIVQTILKGAVYLRLTIMNPFTTEEIFEALLNEIRQIANKSISLF